MRLTTRIASRWRALPAAQRVALGIGLVALLLVPVLAAVLAASGEDRADGLTIRRATPTPTVPRSVGLAGGVDDVERLPLLDVEPGQRVVGSVSELIADFGQPPGTDFARLRIPALGVDAPVGAWPVGHGEQMPEPHSPADVAWYDLAAFPGMGGRPGEGGNALFGGHVDWGGYVPYAEVAYRGLAVFGQINHLSRGDIIEVDYQGQTLRYQVVWRQQLSADPGATDWAEIWRGTPGVDEITLYTCGGDFDRTTLQYHDRIVVRAERL